MLRPGMTLTDMNIVQVYNIKFCEGYNETNLTSCPVDESMALSYKFFNE